MIYQHPSMYQNIEVRYFIWKTSLSLSRKPQPTQLPPTRELEKRKEVTNDIREENNDLVIQTMCSGQDSTL
jgi:hypothetical protein